MTRSSETARSGVLLDPVDLVGDEAVGFTVDTVGGLGVRGVDQAEQLPRRLVDPVLQVLHLVRVLGGEVGGVRGGSVLLRHPSLDVVYVHEQWHGGSFAVIRSAHLADPLASRQRRARLTSRLTLTRSGPDETGVRARSGPSGHAVPRPSRAVIWVSESSKLSTPALERIRSGFTDFGITMMPCCRCQRMITCAGVRPRLSAIPLIVGCSSVPPRKALYPSRAMPRARCCSRTVRSKSSGLHSTWLT